MLLSNPEDTTAESLRSRVRYMDYESIWLDEPEGAWRPRQGAAIALQSETRGIRYETTVPFRERTADPQPLWRLDRPADDAIERSAARADMRQKVWISGAAVEVFGETDKFQHGKRFPVTVVDLSAGGALLESAVEIPVGAELEHMLTFPLPHEHESLRVDVRRLESIRIERFGNARHRVRLLRPTSGVTNQIARYVFDVDAASRRQSAAGRAHVEEPYPARRALALLAATPRVRLEFTDERGAARRVEAPLLNVTRSVVSIEAPTAAGGLAGLGADHPLILLIHDTTAKVNVVGDTRRLGVVDGTPIRWTLQLPTEFRQRIGRAHVRWPVVVTDAQVVAVDAGAYPPRRVRSAVTIVNLSAGGAAFLSTIALPTGPMSGHKLGFSLPDVSERFSVRLQVVGVQRRRMSDRTVFLYRSQFRNFTEPEREEITRQIYRLQTEQRREERDAAS